MIQPIRSNKMKWFELELKEATRLIEEAKDIMEGLKEAQEEKNENYPENLQGGDRFSTMEERLDYFEQVYDSLEEANETIGGIE